MGTEKESKLSITPSGMTTDKPKKVGLALGSGAFRGFAHIGVIQTLQKNDIHIDFVAGSSAGAIVGAYFALHGEVDSLEKIALDLKRRNLLKLIDVTRSRRSIIAGHKLRNFLDKIYHSKTFSDTKIPLRIIAADLRSGKIAVLKQGNLAEAVLASMSVPGLFPPVALQDMLLVDGGVVNPTPVDIVKKMGAEVVIGVDLTMAKKIRIKNPSLTETLLRSLDLIRTQATKYNIENVKSNLILIRLDINAGFNLLKQFLRAKDYIREGEKQTMRALTKIKKLL